MKPWKTLTRRTLIQNRRLTVESHAVELPDGRQINDWQWVIVPDYVNVMVLTPEHEFLCFRQTKYAVDGTSLAPVGGVIDEGESPLEAARRELREEMGYQSDEWISLGKYATDANRGVGVGYLFLALEATYIGRTTSDELEEQELVRFSESGLRKALLAGEFKVMSWAANVGLALMYAASIGYGDSR